MFWKVVLKLGIFCVLAIGFCFFVFEPDQGCSERAWKKSAPQECAQSAFLRQENKLAKGTVLNQGVICAKRGISSTYLVTYENGDIKFIFNFSFSEQEKKEVEKKGLRVVVIGNGPSMDEIELTLPVQTDLYITGLADQTGVRPEKTYVISSNGNNIWKVKSKIKRAIKAQQMVFAN